MIVHSLRARALWRSLQGVGERGPECAHQHLDRFSRPKWPCQNEDGFFNDRQWPLVSQFEQWPD